MNISQLKLQLLPPILRQLPVGFRGKARAARYLLGSALDAKDIFVTGYDESKYLVPSLREPIGFHLLVDGVYEKAALDLILARYSPETTFLDIGANIGLFSITVAKAFPHEYTNIIALEASPLIISYLSRNIEINKLNNIEVLNFAITDVDDSTVDFYEAPREHFGMASLAPQFNKKSISVRTKTLDGLILEKKLEILVSLRLMWKAMKQQYLGVVTSYSGQMLL